MTVRSIPDGFHTATPSLITRDAASALAFYKRAFGALELMRLTDGDSGKVMHAEMKIGDSTLMLTDEVPEWGNHSPQTLGGSSVHIHLYVEDADAMFDQAVAEGAEVMIPVSDQFYGDRSGRLADPFGHVWTIATHKEDMTPEEMQKRAEAFMQGHG